MNVCPKIGDISLFLCPPTFQTHTTHDTARNKLLPRLFSSEISKGRHFKWTVRYEYLLPMMKAYHRIHRAQKGDVTCDRLV